MSRFFRLKKYLSYQWNAKTKYYIHSPFVYQLFLNVLEGESDANGSNPKQNSVDVGEPTLKKKYVTVLHRLISYCGSKHILEIGPYPTIHLAEEKDGMESIRFVPLDSVRGRWTEQLTNSFEKLDLVFINSLEPDEMKESFQALWKLMSENSVLVVNNIHETHGVNQSWNEIKDNSLVTLSIELFHVGICFFRKEKMAKENFVLRY